MKRPSKHRQRLAVEAARLMFEEGVSQYLDAKRIAARRLFGRSGAKQVRFRPADLPSNGEIRAELLAMAALAEGPSRHRRLFAMRAVALQTMAVLAAFEPRLIGSVASGHIRRGSDIDLHVFTDVEDALTLTLSSIGWGYDLDRVAIQKDGRIQEFLHVYLDRGFPVELSVYPTRQRRITTRSSTDGLPIDRVSPARLRMLLAAEHAMPWAKWGGEGEIPELVEALADGPAPGRFDGLLAELTALE
ncbi:MAG: hypothetical protein ACI8RZ_001461 [Myxococcota bacterium]|jgi:hypothetical protein